MAGDITDTGVSDLARLVEHGRAVRTLAVAEQPSAVIVAGRAPAPGARLGLLAGSWNPPTVAHFQLARAGLASGRLDQVCYVLSTRTVDKEIVTGATLEDRLLMLDLLIGEDPRLGVMLVNRGLYVDQARIVTRRYPDLGGVVFVVGFDKIVQIFDARYYDDRDAALEALFALAMFLVAPRGEDDEMALAGLLSRPENRRFAGAIGHLPLPATLRNVASSAVRASLADGRAPNAAVPAAIDAFIAATGAYADDGRYAERTRQVEAAIRARLAVRPHGESR